MFKKRDGSYVANLRFTLTEFRSALSRLYGILSAKNSPIFSISKEFISTFTQQKVRKLYLFLWEVIFGFIFMKFIFGTLRSTVVGGDVDVSSQLETKGARLLFTNSRQKITKQLFAQSGIYPNCQCLTKIINHTRSTS